MIKFLINFASFVVCVGLLAFGGYQTVQEMKLEEMIGEFETALEYTPDLPELPGSGDNGDSNLPGGDNGENEGTGDNNQDGNMGDSDEKPGDENQGGSSGGCESGDIPGDDDNNGNGGGESYDPSDPENPADPEGPSQPENPSDPDDPNQGGDVETPEENEPVTPPANESLSTEEAKNAFGDLYDNHDADFAEVKKEMVTGMISGFLGSIGGSNGGNSGSSGSGSSGSTGGEQPEEPIVPDEEEDVEIDFGAEFNPDEFEPDEEEPEQTETSEIEELIGGIVNTYVDNLFAEIENQQAANEGATTEESEAARNEFVEREAEAFAGLVNVVNNPSTDEDGANEQLVQSVDAVLNSTVCLGTVSQSVENNPELTETIQEATQGMREETRTEIQNKIEEAMSSNPEKEQQYKDLANLFGITLGANVEIPEGYIPQ